MDLGSPTFPGGPPPPGTGSLMGKTSSDGCIVFNDDIVEVQPSQSNVSALTPCFEYKVLLPARPSVEPVKTNCVTGGDMLKLNFTVPAGESGAGVVFVPGWSSSQCILMNSCRRCCCIAPV